MLVGTELCSWSFMNFWFLARNQMFNHWSVCILAYYVFRSSLFTCVFLWHDISMPGDSGFSLCSSMGKIVLHASPKSNSKPFWAYFSKNFLEKEIELDLHNLYYINQYHLIFSFLSRIILKRFNYSSNFQSIGSKSTSPRLFFLFSQQYIPSFTIYSSDTSCNLLNIWILPMLILFSTIGWIYLVCYF